VLLVELPAPLARRLFTRRLRDLEVRGELGPHGLEGGDDFTLGRMALDEIARGEDLRAKVGAGRAKLARHPRRFGQHVDLLGELPRVDDLAARNGKPVVRPYVVEQVNDLLRHEEVGGVGRATEARGSHRGDQHGQRDEGNQLSHGSRVTLANGPAEIKE
jgi:hypothetical protein